MLKWLRDFRARRQIKGMFGKYISVEAVNEMVRSGKSPQLGGTEVELTAFFASLHNYVGIAEQVPLRQLPELMNTYFGVCGTAIDAEGGTIDKFIGDAIVAMFGAPIPIPDQGLRGCVAALQCQQGMHGLRERLGQEGAKWPERARNMRLRIGLNTGVAIVGNMGTPTRFMYTMMGDNVNLAARMESGAKSYGVEILCTDATKRACEQAEAGRVHFRSLGPIVIKGRASPVELFEPLGLRGNISDQVLECIARFEEGLGCWRERDWERAIGHFERSARLEPNQPGTVPGISLNPSTVFLELARSYQANPGSRPIV